MSRQERGLIGGETDRQTDEHGESSQLNPRVIIPQKFQVLLRLLGKCR